MIKIEKQEVELFGVQLDITAPFYWWKEIDLYRIMSNADSCTTMDNFMEKELTLEDFSHEHLSSSSYNTYYNPVGVYLESPYKLLLKIIAQLNNFRRIYISLDDVFKNVADRENIIELQCAKQDIWRQVMQLLPASYNQKRTIMLPYAVLAGIYKSKINNNLDEWKKFCRWVEGLPCYNFLVGYYF